MYLDDRKVKILQAIIDDYINTAEPVGSRTVSRKYELGISSATIRNEMADLEEMGFLEQPHTSAGRIPSDAGYRLYVDRMMKLQSLTSMEMECIQQLMDIKIKEIHQLIKQASITMSRITRYTAMATAPKLNRSTIMTISLVQLDQHRMMVIMVTSTGIVRNSIISNISAPAQEKLENIARVLTARLGGMTLDDISLPVIEGIRKEVGEYRDLISAVMTVLSETFTDIDKNEVYVGGTTNIFNFPEYNDIAKARDFLNFLETENGLNSLLKDEAERDSETENDDMSLNITIGKENKLEEAQDCTLVTATYSYKDKVIGKLGVIGPTRMEYGRVVSALEYIRKIINLEIEKLLGEESP